ncbi:alpha-amylase 3, chloroplastic-like [Cynara cardunculus var. scolymus]|uniref:alpha-amylase 3, chloroplastic-like n=1 Tax=Cynara cardunculus var. scolymus TaxID=59895 RepID=UPI000D630017|nr:alpha-amylase 3, chloroplastic-like [Cynara cardunculus var. scolymus]
MATVPLQAILHRHYRRKTPKFLMESEKHKRASLYYTWKRRNCLIANGAKLCNFRPANSRVLNITVRASSNSSATTCDSADVIFHKTFSLQRTEKVEGKILVRLDCGKDEENFQLVVACNLPGKWVLHWGINYVNDIGSDWDQPPVEMIPLGSVPIKDYAIDTPLKKLTDTEAGFIYEVKIDFNTKSSIAAINFVLRDEETGSCYQLKGRDFKVPLTNLSDDDGNNIGTKQEFSIWPGTLGQLSNMLLKSNGASEDGNRDSNSKESAQKKRDLRSFYEEHDIVKQTLVDNSISVCIKRCPEAANNLLHIETDIPGDVVVHWGVCKDASKKWEIPTGSYPAKTSAYKTKALQTQLQQKEGGCGCSGLFPLDEGIEGFLFVLKTNNNTWLNFMGDDFYIPMPNERSFEKLEHLGEENMPKSAKIDSSLESGEHVEVSQEVSASTDEIINEIRHLVTGISSEKSRKTKSIETQESILREIEKLAAEAYSIFRSSIPSFTEKTVSESKEAELPLKISSGTGSGFEILCQGFNWESHKSRRWYMELHDKVAELSSLGFTIVWLPPPTESISPEGYMPKDLYNLNSRYGHVDELKALVNKFHEVGIRVLGDAVINHRCAHHQNQNGVWNIFGGRLGWDDRAVVGDDPHFQGRGNKSSGDNFHAAPNIDHSQDFVRKDLKEWLCWLRKEIGYDGWRLDFVRGFWGGYVKDYMEASEPYFAVGEYWDSLNYTYGEMDHNQDTHRQRIIDWINATNGTAGAFDVTTKGILHSALERCEYWRLSDSKGKPPGVVGWWPSRAVTFIENHDTGSTQGHWRFPGGKEMQGYAYILTHPGTPSVFYDHIFSDYKSRISALISIRNRNKIHCRSTVEIIKAERDVYAAIVDEKLAMKIGPGDYELQSSKWCLAAEGNDYKVWEAL